MIDPDRKYVTEFKPEFLEKPIHFEVIPEIVAYLSTIGPIHFSAIKNTGRIHDDAEVLKVISQDDYKNHPEVVKEIQRLYKLIQ